MCGIAGYVGDAPAPSDSEIKFAHTLNLKTLPSNAIVREYTAEMAASGERFTTVRECYAMGVR